jgi:hypothetical protein
MLVGHTKFAPDGNEGLIKYRYRRLKIYTYQQLAKVIEESSENGHNVCQRYRDNSGLPNFSYRDWSTWFSKYFKKLPNITKYHHFHIDSRELGVVKVKKEIDGTEEKYILLKKNSPLTFKNNHVVWLRSLSLLDCLLRELGIFMKKFVNTFQQ